METAFVEFDVDCDADLIRVLSYDKLRAHDLVYVSDEFCLCAEHGRTTGRRVRLDLCQNCQPLVIDSY